MIGSCQVKVCGITRAADATAALHLGADWIGINTWEGSPRCVPPARRPALLREIPRDKRVAVTVNPTPGEAVALLAEGFAILQVHFDPSASDCDPHAVSASVGTERLWLAPRLPDGAEFPALLLPLAAGFVHDAHQAGAFGGTGRRGDWDRFLALQSGHPDHLWILAGGLGPDTVVEAARRGARVLDLNSGVEISPGLKSVDKLHLVGEILRKFVQKKAE